MIPLVKMCLSATGDNIPEAGLVLHASFRDGILAESGQELNISQGDICIVRDDDLGRNVLDVDRGVLSFSQDGLPVGDAPFTVALLAKFHHMDDNSMILGWGSTPWGETVAAIRYVGGGVRLSAWGESNTGPEIDPDGGTWHHWCGVYDGFGHPQLYLDGEPAAAGNFHFDIGEELASLGTFWAGESVVLQAANVRIYDRALTPAEIEALAKER